MTAFPKPSTQAPIVGAVVIGSGKEGIWDRGHLGKRSITFSVWKGKPGGPFRKQRIKRIK